MTVRFSPANTKLKKLYKAKNLQKYLTNKRKIYSFDLLSGHACPFADRCLSKVIETKDGLRIQDGSNTEFRCFSASQEVIYTSAYKKRKANFDALRRLKTQREMVAAIESALPKNAGIVRIHVSGDFFNRKYFGAWLEIARRHPNVLFYAYTKALNFWTENRNDIPSNLVLTASYGGTLDNLIEDFELRYSLVVENEIQASSKDLVVDNDDSHAADPDKRHESFALVIHGVQPKGRKALVV